MIWTNPRNGACCTMYSAPRHSMAWASHSAECTALRAKTIPSPPVQRRALHVVVLLGLAQPHRMRSRLHSGQQRRQQILLGVDQISTVVVGHLVLVGHGQCAGRARLNAQPAVDTAQVVDLVNRTVALPWRVPGLLGVVATLDVDGVGGAGPGAQLAS